jgi:CDP-paratose synthetase
MPKLLKKQHFLVTGATGFLGSNIVHTLIASGATVTILYRKQSNFSRIRDYLDKINLVCIEGTNFKLLAELDVDFVLHCATSYSRPDQFSVRETIDANLIFPLLILESINRGRKRPVFINTDTSLPRGVNFYSLSKHQFVEWAKVFSVDLKIINMKLSHFYGPGDNNQKFVSWLLGQLLDNVDYINLTEGNQHRDFIYIDDIVSAIVAVLESVVIGKIEENFAEFYIGCGSTVSLRDFCLLAKRISGSSAELRFGAIPYRENEIMMPTHDNTFIKSLEWKPKIEPHEGLARTMKNFKKLTRR